MNLREQTYVLALARHGSIKAAAEELFISSPTLSIFLSNLEENMGLRLFDRLGKRFVPTQAGALYIKTAREMVNLRNSYEAELSDIKNGTTGTISFGIHPRRTLYLLSAVLKEFCPLYPDVQINTCEEISAVTFPLLLEGELDFIINNHILENPNLIYTPFYKDRLVVVMAADHPLADRGVLLPGHTLPWMDLSLLQHDRFIIQRPDQSSRTYTDKAITHAHVKPRQTIVVSNLESAAQLAAEGVGISFNFENYVRHFTYEKPVRYFYVGDMDDTINFYITYRKDKYLPNYTLHLMSLFRNHIRL